MKKTSLPVDVRRSKTPLLKLPNCLSDSAFWYDNINMNFIFPVDDSTSSQMVLEEASRICSQEFDIDHSTIQVETSSEKTAECIQCDEPAS